MSTMICTCERCGICTSVTEHDFIKRRSRVHDADLPEGKYRLRWRIVCRDDVACRKRHVHTLSHLDELAGKDVPHPDVPPEGM